MRYKKAFNKLYYSILIQIIVLIKYEAARFTSDTSIHICINAFLI